MLNDMAKCHHCRIATVRPKLQHLSEEMVRAAEVLLGSPPLHPTRSIIDAFFPRVWWPVYIYIIKILNKCNMRNKINYIMDQFCTTLHIEGVQNWASNLRHGNIVDGCMHCTQDVLWTGSRLAHPLCLTQFGIHTLLLGEACIAAAKTFAHGPNGIRNATLSTCWEHALLG